MGPPQPRVPAPAPRPGVPRPAKGTSERPPGKRGGDVEPSVLLVGAGETLEQALATALARHKVYVEVAPKEAVVDAVVATAPDLILLAGDAAKDCGADVLSRLAGSPMSSVVPVAILEDDMALDERLRAFRHGAAAVIPRSASIDAIADQVAQLAREIPDRGGESLGVVGEATLKEFVATLGKELRSGILSVSAGEGNEHEAVRLVLGRGRPLADFIDDFVKRVRRHVVHAEPLRYEFDERAGGTVELLGADELDAEPSVTDVRDLRLVLADGDSTRADSVAQELRTHGAAVAVTDLAPSEPRFTRLRQVDPSILLIGENDVQGAGYELVRRMRRDTRLRWASLLVVRWDEVWSENASVPAIGRLAGTLAALAEPEHAIRARAEGGVPFDTRLEIVGPARCLRALATCSHAQRVTIHNPRVHLEIDLSNNLVVGATGHTLGDGGQQLEGPAALAALLVLSSGRVHVEPVEQPATANLMATIDVALNLAEAEPPPIPPSLPSPATSMPPPPMPPAPGLPQIEANDDGQALEYAAARSLAKNPVFVAGAIGGATLVVGLGVVALLLAGSGSAPTENTPAPASAGPAPARAAQDSAASSAEPSATARSNTDPASGTATSASSSGAAVEGTEVSAGEGETGATSAASVPSCEKLLAGDSEPSAPNPSAARDELRAARRELVRGDLDATHRAYCRALVYDPENSTAMLGIARLLVLRRDGKGALHFARRAQDRKPGDGNVLNILGDALALSGDENGARNAWLSSAGITSPKDPAVRALAARDLRLGLRAFDLRDYGRAERLFRRAVVFEPGNVQATLGLARTLVVLGDGRTAVVWAKRAVKLASRNAATHVVLGDALAATGNDKAATAEWRAALTLDPESPDASSRLKVGK